MKDANIYKEVSRMTTNYREILRLKSLGLNKTDIARSAGCARNTVSATLERAAVCGVQWPLPDGMSDKDLAEKLFPSAQGKAVFKIEPSAHWALPRPEVYRIEVFQGE